CKMPAELREASFRFAQSVAGVTLTVLGMGTEKELEQNVGWARTYKPMTADEADGLTEKTVALARGWGAHLDLLDARGEKRRPTGRPRSTRANSWACMAAALRPSPGLLLPRPSILRKLLEPDCGCTTAAPWYSLTARVQGRGQLSRLYSS